MAEVEVQISLFNKAHTHTQTLPGGARTLAVTHKIGLSTKCGHSSSYGERNMFLFPSRWARAVVSGP